jgi:hypothetical protein
MHFSRDCCVTDFCSCKIGIPYVLYISAVLTHQPSAVVSELLRLLALIAMDGMYAGFAGAKPATKKLLFLGTTLRDTLAQTKTIIGNSEFPILKTVVSIGTPIRLSAISANRA